MGRAGEPASLRGVCRIEPPCTKPTPLRLLRRHLSPGVGEARSLSSLIKKLTAVSFFIFPIDNAFLSCYLNCTNTTNTVNTEGCAMIFAFGVVLLAVLTIVVVAVTALLLRR